MEMEEAGGAAWQGHGLQDGDMAGTGCGAVWGCGRDQG